MKRAVLCAFFASIALVVGEGRAAQMVPEGAQQTPQRPADPAMANYASGAEALLNGNLDAAEKAFRAATGANPRMPQPLLGLADVAQRRNQRTEAKKWLDEAAAVSPRDDGVQLALAAFYITGQDFAGAEVALKRAVDLNPTNLRARLDLADLYANFLRRPTDAITEYRNAITIDRQHAGAHHGLATALAAVGQFDDAEREFRRSAELAPAAPLPLHSLARLQLSRGQSAAALASLDAVLKIEPNFLPALLDKGDLALGQGKSEDALMLYRQAVDKNPKSAQAQFKYGAMLQTINQLEDAKKAYETAIDLNPQFAEAYNNLAWMQAQLRLDLGQAAQYAATAVKLAPDNAAYRDTLGWVHRAQKQLPEAETVLEKAATMQPRLADVQYHLGVVYAEQSKKDQARKAFENALEIDPKHAEAKAALSRVASGL
jgi:tetratricopeptide (TPR) repeat protein